MSETEDAIREAAGRLAGVLPAIAKPGWEQVVFLISGRSSLNLSGSWARYPDGRRSVDVSFPGGDAWQHYERLGQALNTICEQRGWHQVTMEIVTDADGSFRAYATPDLHRDSYGAYRYDLRDAGPVWQPAPRTNVTAAPAGDPEQAVALLAEFRQRVAELVGRDPVNGPADPTRIDELEQQLGFALPADLRALYALADGEHDEGPGIMGGWAWLSLESVRSEYQNGEAYYGSLLDWDDIVHDAYPPDTVQRVPWDTCWVPFAADHSGNYYAVDLNPAANGRPGQVIIVGRDHDQEPTYVAPSVTDLLRETVEALQAGSYEHDGEALWIDMPERKSPPADRELADWAAGLPGEWPGALRHRVTAPDRARDVMFNASDIARDLSPIARFPMLEAVRLWQLEAGTDLAPLAALHRLRHLQVSYPEATTHPDLSAVRNLPLEVLELSGWPADLTPLAGHPTLRSLTLRDPKGPVDLTPLGKLPSLRHLKLTGVPVESLRDGGWLAGLDELRRLELTHEQWAVVATIARELPKLATPILVANKPWSTRMLRALRWAAAFDREETGFGEPFHRGHQGEWFAERLVMCSGRVELTR